MFITTDVQKCQPFPKTQHPSFPQIGHKLRQTKLNIIGLRSVLIKKVVYLYSWASCVSKESVLPIFRRLKLQVEIQLVKKAIYII